MLVRLRKHCRSSRSLSRSTRQSLSSRTIARYLSSHIIPYIFSTWPALDALKRLRVRLRFSLPAEGTDPGRAEEVGVVVSTVPVDLGKGRVEGRLGRAGIGDEGRDTVQSEGLFEEVTVWPDDGHET